MRRPLLTVLPVLPVLIVTLVASLSGCPGDDDDDEEDSDGEEGEGEGDDIGKQELGDAFVAFFDRCVAEQIPQFQQDAEPLLTQILVGQLSGGIEETFRGPIDSEDVTLNAVAAAACIDALATVPCEGADQPQSCIDALVGTLADGDSCAFGSECSAGLTCFQPDGRDICGVCRAPVEPDGNCEEADCVEDFDCVDNVCVPAEPDPDDLPPFALGDPCDANFDGCELLTTGLACVAGECVLAEVVGVGEPCDPVTESARYCVNKTVANFCVPDTGDPTVGSCEARPAVGENCSFDSLCVANEAICVANECTLGGGASAACAAPSACQIALECSDGTCAAIFGDDFITPVCE